MNRRTFLLATVLALGTAACSTTDLLKAAGGALGVSSSEPMVGIDTEIGDDVATLGDSQSLSFDDVEGDVAIDTTNNKNSVDKAQNVTYNEFTPLTMGIMGFLGILAIVGWAAPQISFRSPFWRKEK